MTADPREFVAPFISPLTHDQHARLGRIAILWGQVDMILDYLLEIAMDISARQRQTLIGEKPLGAKLDMLSNHLDEIKDNEARNLVQQFYDLADQTKMKRNRCFHGIWGFRAHRNKVSAAASHFKAQDDPVTTAQLPPLEKKLNQTARVGFRALSKLAPGFNHDAAAGRLFHGKGKPPAWLGEWIEQHPVNDAALGRKWKPGQLPFLEHPV